MLFRARHIAVKSCDYQLVMHPSWPPVSITKPLSAAELEWLLLSPRKVCVVHDFREGAQTYVYALIIRPDMLNS